MRQILLKYESYKDLHSNNSPLYFLRGFYNMSFIDSLDYFNYLGNINISPLGLCFYTKTLEISLFEPSI